MEELKIITRKQERQIKIRRIVVILTIVVPVITASIIMTVSYFTVKTVLMNPQINLTIGTCEFRESSDDAWRKAEIGASIDQGYEFKTGPGSMMDLILQDRTAIRIAADSTFVLEKLSSRKITVDMKSGTFYGKIKKLLKFQSFKVKTHTLVASVRGTEFAVSAGENPYLGQCIEGCVEITDGSSDIMVGKNMELAASGTAASKMSEPDIASLRKIIASIKLNRMLFMAENLLFETGSFTVDPSMEKELDMIYDKIKDVKGIITIIGNTDNVGDPAVNKNLSLQRADSIRSYFISRGFSAAHLRTLGLGSEQPLYSNETDEGRRRNRRVEFVVIKD